MSVQRRRARAVKRRHWVAEMRERWESHRETDAILADPDAMAAIAEARAEAAS